MSFVTTSAYQFCPIDAPQELRKEILKQCTSLELKGTVLLAFEGINYFLAGVKNNLDEFRKYLETTYGFYNLCYKEHPCNEIPFTRLLVKVKKEIISMGQPEIQPNKFTAPYISAEMLKSWLDENRDIVLLDTRNTYEVAVGTFHQAVHLEIDSFREFPASAKAVAADWKNRPIVTFCTGGIRCEKAAAFLLKEGFQEVYQLEGGILKYFEDCESAHYQGNCFVFDWRLSVDSTFQAHLRSPEEPINAGRHQFRKAPQDSKIKD
jgi:predicted sulfurtransferase